MSSLMRTTLMPLTTLSLVLLVLSPSSAVAGAGPDNCDGIGLTAAQAIIQGAKLAAAATPSPPAGFEGRRRACRARDGLRHTVGIEVGAEDPPKLLLIGRNGPRFLTNSSGLRSAAFKACSSSEARVPAHGC
jgi:hypothetical protein